MEASNPKTDTPPERSRAVRVTVDLIMALIVALLLLIVAGAVCLPIFNRLGKRAYEQSRLIDERHGERYDFEKLLPAPVSDDQNMAMTPLLAPLLDYTLENGQARWRQPEAVQRLQSDRFFGLEHAGIHPPETGNWEVRRRTDLKLWQHYYSVGGRFELPEKVGTPAEDVLTALNIYNKDLEELRTASRRLHAHFPIGKHAGEGFDLALPHNGIHKKIAIALRLHSLAALEAGKPDLAIDDLKITFRLQEAARNEPVIVSHLVNLFYMGVMIQPVWEGLAKGQWQEEQLRVLQHEFEDINEFSAMTGAVRGDRAMVNAAVLRWLADRSSPDLFAMGADATARREWKQMAPFIGTGLVYYNLTQLNELHREFIDLSAEAETGTGGTREDFLTYNSRLRALFSQWNPWKMGLSRKFLSDKVETKTRRCQTILNLAATACALERFRIAESTYPASLNQLVPRYLTKPLPDPMDGKPLRYRLERDGLFTLYSVGSNGVDDGGKFFYNSDRSGPEPDRGDIVWSYEPAE